MATLDTNALFTQYLNVVNQAIGNHKNQFPYKQLIDAGDKILGDTKIDAAIYKRDADNPHHHATIIWSDGTFELQAHEKPEGDDVITWKMAQAHLEEVVDNPDPYKANPARLNLDWLKTRFGAV